MYFLWGKSDGKIQKKVFFIGFSGIFGHISQFLNSSDSVIRWFESSYPSQISALFSEKTLKSAFF